MTRRVIIINLTKLGQLFAIKKNVENQDFNYVTNFTYYWTWIKNEVIFTELPFHDSVEEMKTK